METEEKETGLKTEIISFDPPLTGVLRTNGQAIFITGYLPDYPPQFRYTDGLYAEIMTTGEDIIIDDAQLLKPLKPPEKKERKFSESVKKKIRERLLQEAAKIKKERDSTIIKFREETKNTSQPKSSNHPAEVNDNNIAVALLKKKTENSDKRLGKIGLALVRLEYNLYGLCKRCGEEISLERLNQVPATDVHTKCKGEGHSGRHNRAH